MKIVGVNGINTPFGKNKTTDRLLSLFRDKIEIYDFNYKELTATLTMHVFNNDKLLGAKLENIVKDTDIVFGHSFGCSVIHQACLAGMKCKDIILFSAALDVDAVFPKDCVSGSIYNVYNPKDWMLRLGRLVPFSSMGSFGMQPAIVPTITNINAASVHKKQRLYCHSDYFEKENIAIWENLILLLISGIEVDSIQ